MIHAGIRVTSNCWGGGRTHVVIGLSLEAGSRCVVRCRKNRPESLPPPQGKCAYGNMQVVEVECESAKGVHVKDTDWQVENGEIKPKPLSLIDLEIELNHRTCMCVG